MPFVSDYNGGALPLDAILEARRRIRDENRNGGHAACSGCAYLEKKAWGPSSDAFEIIGIANFSFCNIECNYCYLQTQDPESFKSGFDPYALNPAFKELIDRGLLSPGAVIDWGGGEPTIYREFDALFELLDGHGCRHFIHTNATYIPRSFRGGVTAGRVHIICSVDAGFPETYKKIKNRNLLDEVWRNLEQFKRLGCTVTIKYIVSEDNCSAEELDAFLARVKEFGASSLLVDVDYHKKHHSDAVVDGIVRLRCQAYLRALHTDFGFTGARFRPDSDLEERVARGIRRFCAEEIKKQLTIEGMASNRSLDRLARLYYLHLGNPKQPPAEPAPEKAMAGLVQITNFAVSQMRHEVEADNELSMAGLLGSISVRREEAIREKDAQLRLLADAHERLMDGARRLKSEAPVPEPSALLFSIADEQMRDLEAKEQSIRQVSGDIHKLNEELKVERLKALEAAADERLAALQEKDRELSAVYAAQNDLREQLERAVATIGEQHRRSTVLETAADERLAELQEKQRELSTVYAAIDDLRTQIAERRLVSTVRRLLSRLRGLTTTSS